MDDEPHFLDDPVRVYVRELHTLPPLTREEEIGCIQHLRAGDEHAQPAMKRLFEANLLLVVSIAERYQSDPVRLLDLIAIGNKALERALQTRNSEDSVSTAVTAQIERAIAEAAAR